jgi:transposase
MRFYTKQHPLYCGIDLHARTMSLCILNQDGAMLVHRHMSAGPAPFLKAVAPSRTELVVCVACLCTWYWLADLCAREGMPVVLGHALSMKASHGGKAKNDQIDAQKIAGLLRGGRLPQAYGSPAEMRATRALLRRRRHLMRQRAARLTPLQQTNRQSHVPEIGKQIADKTNRAGGAERFAAPAVHQSVEVARALLAYYDPLLQDLEVAMVQTAKPHDAHTLSLFQTVPGLGKSLRRVLLSELHDIARFPRGQDVVSSCRLVTCAKASAGQRSGTSGTQSGNASLQWAFSEAAVFFLRNTPPGQQSLARLENKPGKGQALTGLAHQLARAVSSMFQRATACDMQHCLQSSSGAERRSPTPNWPMTGCAWSACSVLSGALRRERTRAQRPLPLSPTLCVDLRSGSALDGVSGVGWTCAAPPPSLDLTGERVPWRLLLAEDGTRGQRCFSVVATPESGRGTRRGRGERTSRSVGCSCIGAPAYGNEDGTRCQGRTALGVTTAEKIGKIRSEGKFVS